MENNTTIHERISQLVKKYGDGKNTVFAELMGESEANIRGYRASVVPKFTFLEKIVTKLDINTDWLLTGRGDMLRHQPPDIAGSSEPKPMNNEHDSKILLRGIDRLTAHIEEQDTRIKELTETNRILTEKLNTPTDSGKPSKVQRTGLGSAQKEQ